jgi:hypothetical protein
MTKEKSEQILVWLALSALLGALARLFEALTEFFRLFI